MFHMNALYCIWLADESANKHLQSMQLRASKALFLKLMRVVLKHVPLERWIQHMIGGLKTVNLAWVNKIAVIGCTWLFVYESALTYEGRMNAASCLFDGFCIELRRLGAMKLLRKGILGHIMQGMAFQV